MHIVHTTNVPKPSPGNPTPAPVTDTAEDDLVIAANISGLGGITKTGPETLVLSGNNSFTGGLVVEQGTLRNIGASQFGGAASLDVSTTLDLPGTFTTAPGAVVTKSGAGTLNITGPQAHGAGAQLVVAEGAVNMNTNAGSTSARPLTINATGGNVSFNASQHVAALNVGDGVNATVTPGGNKTILADSVSVTGSGRLNLNDNHLV